MKSNNKMNTGEQKMSSWIKRVEDLVNMLEGSTIGELELTEAGTEIIIRRQPGIVVGSMPAQLHSVGQPGVQPAPGSAASRRISHPRHSSRRRRRYSACSPHYSGYKKSIR